MTVDEEEERLVRIAHMGPGGDNGRSIPIGDGIIGRTVTQGTTYIADLSEWTLVWSDPDDFRPCIDDQNREMLFRLRWDDINSGADVDTKGKIAMFKKAGIRVAASFSEIIPLVKEVL